MITVFSRKLSFALIILSFIGVVTFSAQFAEAAVKVRDDNPAITLQEAMDLLNAPHLEAFQNDVSYLNQGSSITEDITVMDTEKEQIDLEAGKNDMLYRFGANIFNSKVSTFAPAESIPVPVNYILGPGDVIRFQLIGHENTEGSLPVDRNGEVQLPGFGKISVMGLTFESFEEKIKKIVSDNFIGTRIEVAMGPLRSIRVFVLGDVIQPGSYTVSSLSTITNALFVSGGIDSSGTFRDIQLKRNGVTVTHLDLYDLLINGDSSEDIRLQPGDVIFVPPVGGTVSISGAVNRPAIYEIKGEKTVSDLIALAGGNTQNAYLSSASLLRINRQGERTFYNLDLSDYINLETGIIPGDIVHIDFVLNLEDNVVTLEGHVKRPGRYQWYEGLRIQDIIGNKDNFLPNADLNYVLVYRKSPRSVAYHDILQDGTESSENILLQKRDIIYVFELGKNVERQKTIETLMGELRHLQKSGEPVPIVYVGGYVKVPGQYPLEEGMRVTDLIRAAGGLSDAAYTSWAELTRYVPNEDTLDIAHINIHLGDALSEAQGHITQGKNNLELNPYDSLLVKPYPEWSERPVVNIAGEVRFPGAYALKRGETISQVIERAGGFTKQAFLGGAILTRKSLKEQEQHFLERITARLESDLATALIEKKYDEKGRDDSREVVSTLDNLISKIKSVEPVGRLAFNLSEEIAKGPNAFSMKDGDSLYIPQKPIAVSVFGEVYFPTSHIYNPNLKMLDYIMSSGGFSEKADKRHVYVVHPSGEVASGRRAMASIEAGDTIVVPLKVDRINQLTFWSSISQIFYNIAISTVAIARI